MNLFLEIIPYEERINPQPSKTTEGASTLTYKKEDAQDFFLAQKTKKHRRNQWKTSEQLRYVKFLEKNKKIFVQFTNQQKKNVRSNVLMSKAVQTRTAVQCHSHHQKMMVKYKSIEAIIATFEHLTNKRPKAVKAATSESTDLQPFSSPEPLSINASKQTKLQQEIEQMKFRELDFNDFLMTDTQKRSYWQFWLQF